MVRYMVFKLTACSEGYRIQHNMVVDILRIQMGSDDDLIVITPHPFGSFHSDLVCFLRGYFAGLKALKTMISYIPTHLSEVPLGVHHGPVGVVLGTVDGTNIHLLVRLFVVLDIAQRLVEILVQVVCICGLVRVFCVVDDIF